VSDALLFGAIGGGYLVGWLAPEMGAFMEWLDDRRTDWLAR
jgi:hypothetical protein